MYDMYGTPASVKATEVLRPVSRFASTVSKSHANGGDDAATRPAAGFVTNTLVTGSIRDTTASPKAIRLPSMAIRYRVLFKGRRRMKVLLQPAKSSRGPRAGRTEREKSPQARTSLDIRKKLKQSSNTEARCGDTHKYGSSVSLSRYRGRLVLVLGALE